MLRLALAFVLGLTIVFPSNAQEKNNTKYFYTKQECYPAAEFMQMVMSYDEIALFTGSGVTIGYDSKTFQGAVMFFVNQDTGTWTLGTLYGDNSVCINAAGTFFEPYTE